MANFDVAYREAIASVFSAAPPKAGTADAAFGKVLAGNAAAQAAPTSALDAVNTWELALNRATNRYRNWLTHNMVLLLGDLLNAPGGSSGLDRIKGGFAQNVAEQSIGNLASLGAVKIGADTAGHVISTLLLSAGAARVLGGVAGFVIGAIVEAVIGDLMDKTDRIVGYTAEQVDGLVTGVVNPIVDGRQQQVTQAVQELRGDLLKQNLSADEWRGLIGDIAIATFEVNALLPVQTDERMYRLMALIAGVYSHSSVPAEDQPSVAIAGAATSIGFTMQHREVKTGQTAITVSQDAGTLIVRCRGFDCVEFDDGFSPVDINGPAASPSWKHPPPPRDYDLQLYQTGTVSDSDVSVPRVFGVGREQYGVWFNLPAGTYHLLARRADDHIVALGADGSFWLKTGL